LAGQESVYQKAFLFAAIFGFTAVCMWYLFYWITEQRHIREERILYTLLFCFVCLFVNNNMWWKEEEIKLLFELQTHPTRNIKQAYYKQED